MHASENLDWVSRGVVHEKVAELWQQPEAVARLVKGAASKAGLDPERYSGH